ncbi:MAG: hypothetical protein ACLUUF_02885 [Bifidobacterium pullorum]
MSGANILRRCPLWKFGSAVSLVHVLHARRRSLGIAAARQGPPSRRSSGLHLRSKAIAASAEAKADAAANQAHTLQANLNNQQLADAIAAESHDTLAHSLSLLALNASALQAGIGQAPYDGTVR